MSYDIELTDPVTKKALVVDHVHHIKGGTYALGGTNELHLNITYNYAPHFYRIFGENGIRSLYGKSGAASIPILQEGIAALKDDVSDNYWDATEGNAKQALYGLLAFAQMRPDGIWAGN